MFSARIRLMVLSIALFTSILLLPASAAAQPLPSGSQYVGEPVRLPSQGGIVHATVVADVTGDGTVDIVTAETGVFVVHMGGQGWPMPQRHSVLGFVPVGAVRIEAVDVDRDLDLDIVAFD